MFLIYDKKPIAPVNEAYFGKTKGVKRIEEAIKALSELVNNRFGEHQ